MFILSTFIVPAARLLIVAESLNNARTLCIAVVDESINLCHAPACAK